MIHDIWTYIASQLNTNQFFSGAALAGMLLGILHTLRGWVMRCARMIFRRFVVSLTVHSEDPLYVPMTRWLKANQFDAYAMRYRLRTEESSDGSATRTSPGAPIAVGTRRKVEAPPATLGPDYGTYFFRHCGRWLRVSVAKEGDSAGQGNRRAQTREFLTIQHLGVSQQFLQNLVELLRKELVAEQEQSLYVYTASMNYGWDGAGSMPIFSRVCPVVLADGVLEDLIGDVREFFGRSDWYAERGIPWRRGYLLHGPPGTGKTSVVRHIARTFGLNIYSVGSSGYMNSALGNSLRNVPPCSIILFEDIDTHDIQNRAVAQPNSQSSAEGGLEALVSVSLGDLLNAIDGINPPEQVLIVMTSNRPEAIDPALLRPGRVDRRIHLDRCSREQALRLAGKFFPDATDLERSDFFEKVGEGEFTPAELQEIFIANTSLHAVINALISRAEPRLELVRA